jgi:hypothetical protein
MPIYLFQNPKTKQVKEIVQKMSDEHIYIDEKGVKWDRVFTKPQASIDTQMSTDNSKDFVNKTRNKNYTLGQLWDKSAELSQKRGGMSGKDEIRDKAEKSYEKKTGKRHPHAKKDSTFYI